MFVNCDVEVSNLSCLVVPIDKSLPNSVREDKKDEMILKLVPRVGATSKSAPENN